MNEYPNIINTDIISSKFDAFWEDMNEITLGKQALTTLVVSQPLGAANEEQQLQKMLAACGLSNTDYNLIFLPADKEAAWHQLRDKLQPKYVLLLGIEPQQLGISSMLMPHQVSRFNDCCFIPTLSLAQLEQYPDIKKHLWNYGLKPVFVEKAYG